MNHIITKTLPNLPIVVLCSITLKTRALSRKGVHTHNDYLNDQNTLSYCRRLLTAKINFSSYGLRWPVPIYMRVGYVFDSRFSE